MTVKLKESMNSNGYGMRMIFSIHDFCLQVILAPSPKYTGVLDEPPRYMGEGFVVMSSSLVNLYYYMDEPGLVPEQPQVRLQCCQSFTPLVLISSLPFPGFSIREYISVEWCSRTRMVI